MNVACRDLGCMEYATCWELQRSLFDALLARKRGKTTGGTGSDPDSGPAPDTSLADSPDGSGMAANGSETVAKTPGRKIPAEDAGTILFVEHPPVYTLGKSGRAENLLVSREALEALGARFFHIDRGGDITFHGPGQLVCYPILDLECIGMGLREYIDALEEAVIRTLARYGVAAGRIAGASGVWLGEGTAPHGRGRARKICAIGVRSSRYVTMHGFALNVSTDLDWFARINPCGFTDRGATSLERETGRRIPMEEVKALVAEFLSKKLNVRIYK